MKSILFWLKAFVLWLILAISAIIVAGFRNGVILPAFGELAAHQLGTVIFLIIQFLIIYLFIKKNHLKKTNSLLGLGTFLLILTIIFEFLFGHFVIGHSWEKLFADYNFLQGRIWVLVLINNFVAPLISGKIIKE